MLGCPCSDPVQGPTEEDKLAVQDMGLSDEGVRQLTLEWNRTMGEAQEAILRARGYTWSLMLGQANANAMPRLLTRQTCSSALRQACAAESDWQKQPVLFGLTTNGTQILQVGRWALSA